MKNNNKIGVWMDHSAAKFIKIDTSVESIEIINSDYNSNPREDGHGADGSRFGSTSTNNEHKKNQQEIEKTKQFYKKCEEQLQQYDSILLFGPTNAKNEFKNILDENKNFADKSIFVESADKLTDNQLLEFVNKYFN
jgi:hypothetical protein